MNFSFTELQQRISSYSSPFFSNLILSLFLSFPVLGFSQQSALVCNTRTPWVNGTFSLTETHGSSLLACWDGDFGCVIPGNNIPADVIDGNLNNFATGEILGVGSLTLRVTDATNDYSAGDFAGYVISSSLFSGGIFNSITISTYLNGSFQESKPAFDLIGWDVSLLLAPITVGFVTTLPFDAVQIAITDGLGLGLYNVHYAVLERFCQGPDLVCNMHTAMNSPEFPVMIDYGNTGSNGVSVGTVNNPQNAISASTADYASLINVASILGSTFIAVEEQVVDYPAGTFVGFDIQNFNVVGTGVLDFVTITTYLNGVQNGSQTGGGLLIGGSALTGGRQIIGFVATAAVDKVKLTISQPAGVTLGTTRVYSAIFQKFCEGPALECNTPQAVTLPDHPLFIDGSLTGITGAVCLLCDVINPGNVIDNNLNNFAQIVLAAGLGHFGSLAVKNQLTDYPAGTFAGFHIENPTLVDDNILSGITISTYLNGSLQESETNLGALVTVGSDLLVNTGEQIVGIYTTLPFDEVRIRLGNLVTLDIGTTIIYNVVLESFCEATIPCDTTLYLVNPEFPVYIDWLLTGVDGVACVLCDVDDEQNVISPDTNVYATITLMTNVIGSASIAVRDALYTYPAGTFAGFVIRDVTGLIEADLFESIIISTYLNGALQEFRFGTDLFDLAVVVAFISINSGTYNIGFHTTLPFDEIRITAASVATVDPFTVIRVYSAFVDTRGSEGGELNCCEIDGGPDVPNVCSTDSVTLVAVIPSTGTWSQSGDNPPGASLGPTVSGAATVQFSEPASGVYRFVYAKNIECRDTVAITVINCPPDAVDDMAVTQENTPVVIDVMANDSSPENETAIPVVVDNPANGTVSYNPGDTTFTYTPDPNFVGADTFTYAICDMGTPPLCDTAFVFIWVTPVIDTIYETIPEGGSQEECADDLTVFTSPATSISLCGGPANGNVDIVGTCATYTPDPGYNGQDTFCLVVCHPNDPLLCDTTIVIMTVTPINDGPVAVDDAAQTNEDTPVVIDVLANDYDDDSPLGIPVIVDLPLNGTASVNPGDSTVTYTPNPNFVGQDTFSYEICDDGMPPLCDSAIVVVTVVPVIDTIYETIPEGGMQEECADDLTVFTSPATSISLCGGPANGNVDIGGTCATYTPDMGFNGQDTFCLVVCHPDDPQLCDTTIVIITVTPVNNGPVAVDDAAQTNEDTPVVIDVLANDYDDDSPLGIPVITSPPSFGTADVDPFDSTIIYTPMNNFVGQDTFSYEICDDGMPPLCDAAFVVVTVLPMIDTMYEEVPVGDTLVICADDLVIFNKAAVSIDICGPPTSGTIEMSGSCITYFAFEGFTGKDTFCLVVCHPDDPDLCDTSMIEVTILPPVCVTVNTWIYLEGATVNPSGGGSYSVPMRTNLNDYQVLPGQCFEDVFFGIKYSPPGQPYSGAPWFYPGTEGDIFDSGGDPLIGDAGYPETVVDWILISLRNNAEGTGGPICQAAALLHSDGHIEFAEEFDCCDIDTTVNYYIVIENRNQLIVMSHVPISVENSTITYDFRNQQSYLNDPLMFGIFARQKEILPGVFAMFTGNGNQTLGAQSDTDINFDDRTRWETENGNFGVYRAGDYNFNGDTNFNDRVTWEKNNGKFTSVIRN